MHHERLYHERHHHARPEHADSLHFELPGRARSIGIGDIVGGVADFAKDVGGVAKGVGEGVVDTVTGIVDAVTNPVDTVTGISKLITEPKEAWPAVWHGITDPIVEDWQSGNPGEAIGRGGWTIFETIFGAKGITKLSKIDNLPSRTDKVDDVGRPKSTPGGHDKTDGPDKPEEPDKPDGPDRPDGTGRTPITPSDELLRKTFGELSDDDAAFAKQVNVQHIFHGDEFGGKHVAPGPGEADGVKVVERKATPGRTWTADVTYRDVNGEMQTKSSTMFPKEWTPTEVLQSIRRANENATPTGRSHEQAGRKVDTYEGKDDQLTIVIQKDAETGEILTAHPKRGNKNPKDDPE